MQIDRLLEPELLDALEPGERLRVRAPASDGVLAVTDRRLIVTMPARVALAVPFDGLRRIEFDVDRHRPATLVIVPDHPKDEAQVLSIRPEAYEAAAQALATVSRELARSEGRPDPATVID